MQTSPMLTKAFSATLDTPVVYQSMAAEQDDPLLTTTRSPKRLFASRIHRLF